MTLLEVCYSRIIYNWHFRNAFWVYSETSWLPRRCPSLTRPFVRFLSLIVTGPFFVVLVSDPELPSSFHPLSPFLPLFTSIPDFISQVTSSLIFNTRLSSSENCKYEVLLIWLSFDVTDLTSSLFMTTSDIVTVLKTRTWSSIVVVTVLSSQKGNLTHPWRKPILV